MFLFSWLVRSGEGWRSPRSVKVNVLPFAVAAVPHSRLLVLLRVSLALSALARKQKKTSWNRSHPTRFGVATPPSSPADYPQTEKESLHDPRGVTTRQWGNPAFSGSWPQTEGVTTPTLGNPLVSIARNDDTAEIFRKKNLKWSQQIREATEYFLNIFKTHIY